MVTSLRYRKQKLKAELRTAEVLYIYEILQEAAVWTIYIIPIVIVPSSRYLLIRLVRLVP